MNYAIEHITTFRYPQPVRESVMEVRLKPRLDTRQRCLSFTISTQPRSRLSTFSDHLGCEVHHFNIPEAHDRLVISAESVVELRPGPAIPATLGPGMWHRIGDLNAAGRLLDALLPSHLARPTEKLVALAHDLKLHPQSPGVRDQDPLSFVKVACATIHHNFSYDRGVTKVDSPIDLAIDHRKGVCQDFTHILLAILRLHGIPSRYCSGYLFHRAASSANTGPAQSSTQAPNPADATHAWAEVLLPGLEWLGVDPTNNVLTDDKHIKVAVGRDYDDVPPTRGVYKVASDGSSHIDDTDGSSLSVHVSVRELPAAG